MPEGRMATDDIKDGNESILETQAFDPIIEAFKEEVKPLDPEPVEQSIFEDSEVPKTESSRVSQPVQPSNHNNFEYLGEDDMTTHHGVS